ARVLPRMGRIELPARVLVGLHRDLALLPGPEVLLTLPLAAARVLEERHARKVDRSLAARVVAAVRHVENHAAALDADRVPLVGRVDLAVPRHHRLDPGADHL